MRGQPSRGSSFLGGLLGLLGGGTPTDARRNKSSGAPEPETGFEATATRHTHASEGVPPLAFFAAFAAFFAAFFAFFAFAFSAFLAAAAFFLAARLAALALRLALRFSGGHGTARRHQRPWLHPARHSLTRVLCSPAAFFFEAAMDARAFAFAAFTGEEHTFRPRAICQQPGRTRTRPQPAPPPGEGMHHPAAATAPFLPLAAALALADFFGSTATFSMVKSLRGAIFAVAGVAGVELWKSWRTQSSHAGCGPEHTAGMHTTTCSGTLKGRCNSAAADAMGVQRHHRVQQMPGLGYREGRAQASRLLAEDLALDAAHELDVLLHEGLGSRGAWQRPLALAQGAGAKGRRGSNGSRT